MEKLRDPEIEAIYLTSQEEEDAIYEGKVKKHFDQKAVKNGIKWDTEHEDFGIEVKEGPRYQLPRQLNEKRQ